MVLDDSHPQSPNGLESSLSFSVFMPFTALFVVVYKQTCLLRPYSGGR